MIRRRFLALAALALVVTPFEGISAQTVNVNRGNRDLLLFVKLAPNSGPSRSFYQFTEFAAEQLGLMILGTQYRRVHVVRGTATTRDRLVTQLNTIAANRFVRAVDCIFVTHGLNNRLSFQGGSSTIGAVSQAIRNGVSVARRAKFRMLFSTACFGASHRSGWRQAGFKCVSGSRGVYADSAGSYVPFLLRWALGGTFRQAVDAANGADPARIQDSIAASILFFSGSSLWNQVDSFRVRSGFTDLRIGTQLIGLR